MQAKDRIFVSIDVDTIDQAKRLMDECAGLVSNIKFGLQLATSESWALGIAAAHERGLKVFCDAKFKDIPNTVEQASYSLTHHQPEFFTVMADNSLGALQAARKGTDRAAGSINSDTIDVVGRDGERGLTVFTSCLIGIGLSRLAMIARARVFGKPNGTRKNKLSSQVMGETWAKKHTLKEVIGEAAVGPHFKLQPVAETDSDC